MQGRNRIIMHTYKVSGIKGIKCAVSSKKELVPRSKFQTLDHFRFLRYLGNITFGKSENRYTDRENV